MTPNRSWPGSRPQRWSASAVFYSDSPASRSDDRFRPRPPVNRRVLRPSCASPLRSPTPTRRTFAVSMSGTTGTMFDLTCMRMQPDGSSSQMRVVA